MLGFGEEGVTVEYYQGEDRGLGGKMFLFQRTCARSFFPGPPVFFFFFFALFAPDCIEPPAPTSTAAAEAAVVSVLGSVSASVPVPVCLVSVLVIVITE